MIQNANDASATEVQIEFKTTSEDSSSKRPLIKSIVIRNNGRAFTDDDWRRLKKIAEGNPDEQKVFKLFEFRQFKSLANVDWIFRCWVL